MISRIGFIFLLISLFSGIIAQNGHFKCNDGRIEFLSEAPLETIKAYSSEMEGIIEKQSNRLAFTIPMESFQGFNSPLQQVHFNENYMESDLYPNATFSGKIIEDIDLTEKGSHNVRVKGQLSVHGVIKERIITGKLEIKDQKVLIESKFNIPLSDHNIVVPKIVHQKISPIIQVHVQAELE
jgi:polyisoprenoid-binding protein YceI